MSLYYTHKVLYLLNRDTRIQQRFKEDVDGLLAEFDLTEEERTALRKGDIGLLYVLGVHRALLMHYAVFLGMSWSEYVEAMREGVRRHGPARAPGSSP